MDTKLFLLHLEAGKAMGEERTCGTKVNYKSEESAGRAATSMNAKPTTLKPLEHYPCWFCGGWHLGRRMSPEELDTIAKSA